MTRWKHIIRRAVVSGSNASLFSTAALMLGGHRDNASVFAPVNAVSHWLWKDRAIRQDGPSLRYTLAGYGIHHAMSILWAITYENLVDQRRRRAGPGATHGAPTEGKHAAGPVRVDVPVVPVLATAAVVAAGACLVDLRCTPQRLTPGFERRLSPSSLFLVYAAFALGLALRDSVDDKRRNVFLSLWTLLQ